MKFRFEANVGCDRLDNYPLKTGRYVPSRRKDGQVCEFGSDLAYAQLEGPQT